jgi:hypothetical protein
MSDNKTKLLQEVIAFFNSVGVTPGRGRDGDLMSRIMAEVENDPTAPPVLVSFNPNQRMQCPLCKHPDFNECGCPADEQMAAMM